MLSTNQRAGLVQATNGKARLAVSSTTNYRTHYFDLCGQGSKQTFTLRWFVARLASIATEGHFELWGGQGGIIANYFVCLLYLPSKGFRLTAWLQITNYNILINNKYDQAGCFERYKTPHSTLHTWVKNHRNICPWKFLLSTSPKEFITSRSSQRIQWSNFYALLISP